ncbi:hypothetical protein GCM10023257_41140 [Streptomyces hyderabadensis]|uniref:Uncharacterized protein n=1 Tax=Streptomyces hyderabadensis TaxID=598549 RepID=A0ABP9IEE6_9ACTN
MRYFVKDGEGFDEDVGAGEGEDTDMLRRGTGRGMGRAELTWERLARGERQGRQFADAHRQRSTCRRATSARRCGVVGAAACFMHTTLTPML